MKLYDGLGPNPRVVRIALAEKGMEAERVAVDILKGANRAGEHLQRNPYGGLPSLETDDGRHLAEVTAIVEYLEDLKPEPALLGATPEARAEARMWVRRIDLGIVEPLMLGFRATRARRFFQPRMSLLSEAAGAEMMGRVAEALAFLDGRLAGRDWVCGDRFTLADILLFAFLDAGDQLGVGVPEGAAFLPGWLERCRARPSAGA